MSYKPRVVVPGLPHHVYLRGNNRRLLFASKADRLRWIACVRRALDATNCQMHQMTLMNNRVYGIITPPDKKALSDMVKRACEQYAQTRNQQRNGSGRLFAVGFQSATLADDDTLRVTTLHADSAARRAGLVLDPFVHEWSTARIHADVFGKHELRAIWTPSTWYARLGSTPHARAVAYRQAMIEYIALGGVPAIDREREDEDAGDYRRRVARPNGSWAREGQLHYGRKGSSVR